MGPQCTHQAIETVQRTLRRGEDRVEQLVYATHWPRSACSQFPSALGFRKRAPVVSTTQARTCWNLTDKLLAIIKKHIVQRMPGTLQLRTPSRSTSIENMVALYKMSMSAIHLDRTALVIPESHHV